MDILTITIICAAASILLMLAGVTIAYSLGFCTVLGLLLGVGAPALAKLGLTPFSVFYSLNWTPLPLFILMAYIIAETEIGSDIFDTANNWLSRVPGGLAVASIWAEAGMAATMGASGTTILTVGKVALPQMERLGYNRKFSMGAMLSGGVLGPLIPPSIPFIVYAIMAQQSISELFMAGVIPGILLAVMLSSYAIIACWRFPGLAPKPVSTSWRKRFVSLKKVWPVVVLMVGILGGIYMGVITATEAGGIGALIILLIAVVFYRFRFKNLVRAMTETATLTGMVGLMIIAATLFSYLVGSSKMAQALVDFISSSGLSPWMVIIVINLILLVLGFVMDGLAIMLVTVPLFIPLIEALGFDPIWFGVMMVVNIEIALLTPPVALNLYLMSGTFRVPVSEVIRGVAPFLIVLVIFLAILIAVPDLSLWLPSMMKPMG
ncbi:MAG: TRAP transporter large permease [Dehalococcoidia bacterium]|jgi:tripartite ATP-independent transporter DctM subunit